VNTVRYILPLAFFDVGGVNSYACVFISDKRRLYDSSSMNHAFIVRVPRLLRFARSYVVVACSLFIFKVPLAIKLIFCL
jgi:hypothetical protein